MHRVFNGLLAIRDELSLSSCTLKGQVLTPHIAKVLLQLRLKQYLLTSDVGYAFLCGILREYTLSILREYIGVLCEHTSILCEYNSILYEYSPFFTEDGTDPECKILNFRFRKRMTSSVKMVSSGLFGSSSSTYLLNLSILRGLEQFLALHYKLDRICKFDP